MAHTQLSNRALGTKKELQPAHMLDQSQRYAPASNIHEQVAQVAPLERPGFEPSLEDAEEELEELLVAPAH